MSKETEKIVQSINTLASKLNRIESNYAAIEKKLDELETHRKEHGAKSLKVDAQADSQEAGHGKIDYSSAEIKEHIRVSVYSAMGNLCRAIQSEVDWSNIYDKANIDELNRKVSGLHQYLIAIEKDIANHATVTELKAVTKSQLDMVADVRQLLKSISEFERTLKTKRPVWRRMQEWCLLPIWRNPYFLALFAGMTISIAVSVHYIQENRQMRDECRILRTLDSYFGRDENYSKFRKGIETRHSD